MSEPTKILLVHPGASFSTHDVFIGVKAGLEAHCVKVIEYRLDRQLTIFGGMVDAAIENETLQNPVNVFALASIPAVAIAVHHEVDAVLVISGGNFQPHVAWTLRELSAQRRKPMPVAVYCTEGPYEDEATFAVAYDMVFSNERLDLDKRFPNNERVYYLPHAYNPAIHSPGPAEPDYACDVFFVGTGFEERKRLFDAVNWSGINFVKKGYLWEAEQNPNLLRPENVLPNEDAVRYYRSAAMNLNHHRTTRRYGSGEHINRGDAVSLGPRTYEIAACGGFQVCDDSRARELSEMLGGTVPTYGVGDSAGLERTIRHYLARPDERARLAAAQHEAVQAHSWPKRAADLLDKLLGGT